MNDMTKTKQELVSVVIPVFNVEGYLRRCIGSVLTQSYHNLQVILVDDGSTDGSGRICDELCANEERVEVLHTANSGLSAARNTGMKLVRGSRVVFVDSDDEIGPNHISTLMRALSRCTDPETAVVATGFTEVADGSDVSVNTSGIREAEILTAAQAISESVTLGGRFAAHAWGKLYPKALFNLLQYPVGKFYEDQFVTYKVFLGASEIAYEGANDYLYTMGRPGSISVGSRKRELDYLEAIRVTLLDIQSECPKAIPAVRSRYLGSLIYGLETACLLKDDELTTRLFDEALMNRRSALSDLGLSKGARLKYHALAAGKQVFSFLARLRLHDVGGSCPSGRSR